MVVLDQHPYSSSVAVGHRRRRHLTPDHKSLSLCRHLTPKAKRSYCAFTLCRHRAAVAICTPDVTTPTLLTIIVKLLPNPVNENSGCACHLIQKNHCLFLYLLSITSSLYDDEVLTFCGAS